MLELASDLGFLDEALEKLRLFRVVLEQDLDGDFPPKVEVSPFEDSTHAAAAYLTDQLVTAVKAARRRGLLRMGALGRGSATAFGVSQLHARDLGHDATERL
jgi:hypothetical protein